MINFLDVAPYDFPHPAPDPQAGLKIFINLGSLSLGIILAIVVLVIINKKIINNTNIKNKLNFSF